ncbi:hypothetical protein Trydic_g7873 [Trypoxylus dichotomus]
MDHGGTQSHPIPSKSTKALLADITPHSSQSGTDRAANSIQRRRSGGVPKQAEYGKRRKPRKSMEVFEDARRYPDAYSKFQDGRHWRKTDRRRKSSQLTTSIGQYSTTDCNTFKKKVAVIPPKYQ